MSVVLSSFLYEGIKIERLIPTMENKNITEATEEYEVIEARHINGFEVVICQRKLDPRQREIENSRMRMQLEKCMSME